MTRPEGNEIHKLYTIGSSDRSREEFIELLQAENITLLLDVRSKTGSRTLHFDESRFGNLSAMLEEAGIVYDQSLHLELGGLQNGKMTIGNFRLYTQTGDFRNALEELKRKVAANPGETVILCCERKPAACHRKVIGDYLAEHDGWEVVNIA